MNNKPKHCINWFYAVFLEEDVYLRRPHTRDWKVYKIPKEITSQYLDIKEVICENECVYHNLMIQWGDRGKC